MKISLLTGNRVKKTIIDLADQSDQISWAVAWATTNDVSSTLLHHLDKTTKILIGTHFYQTAPDLLANLRSVKRAKVVSPNKTLFHPKVYLFKNGKFASAIIGSHNLTNAAFISNTEASALIVGLANEAIFSELKKFVDDEWELADQITDEFLFAYEINHRNSRKAVRQLTSWVDIPKSKAKDAKPGPHDLSWREFVSEVKKDHHFSVSGRLKVLEAARLLVTQYDSFGEMPTLLRKCFAGTVKGADAYHNDIHWPWFGAMHAAGSFAELVSSSPQGLSDALTEIPLYGAVNENHFSNFAKIFKEAFSKSQRIGDIATASRLLAMKRPDQFVCLDSANKMGICSHFGVAPTTTNLANYWERIVEQIRLTEWWQEPIPEAKHERRIWAGRSAMLDAIYYDPRA